MYNNYPQTTVPDMQQQIFSNPYESNQYAQNFPMSQFSQPTVYSVPIQQEQQQYASYPQYVDQQSQPQQPPPPSYASVVQSPYPMSVQQQPFQQNNFNPVQNNVKMQGQPFTQGYKWPRKSIALSCPNCGAQIKTRVERTPTVLTFIACILLFLCTIILACVPFCVRACKRSIHYCPHCNSVLGVRKEFR